MKFICLAVTLFLFANSAYADAGLPMLVITWPAMLVALIPVIALEAAVLAKLLKRRFFSLIKSVSIANAASTIVGIPITWVALVVLDIITGGDSAYGITTPIQKFLAVTWQAPWLIPYDDEMYWMTPSASLVLLVPFFFVSYFIEASIIAKNEIEPAKGLVRKVVFKGNLVSYMVLAAFNLIWLYLSISNHTSQNHFSFLW